MPSKTGVRDATKRSGDAFRGRGRRGDSAGSGGARGKGSNGGGGGGGNGGSTSAVVTYNVESLVLYLLESGDFQVR